MPQQWPRASLTTLVVKSPPRSQRIRRVAKPKVGKTRANGRRVTMMTICLSTRSHPHGRARLKPKTFEARRNHHPTNASFVIVITGFESAHNDKPSTHS
ncbi:hypothetical protein V6N13_019630 [Hibiscus sabdariffa]